MGAEVVAVVGGAAAVGVVVGVVLPGGGRSRRLDLHAVDWSDVTVPGSVCYLSGPVSLGSRPTTSAVPPLTTCRYQA